MAAAGGGQLKKRRRAAGGTQRDTNTLGYGTVKRDSSDQL